MKNTFTLKNRNEFQRVLKKGTWFSGDFISLYVMPNSVNDVNLLGVAVGKKYSKSSVKRNRVKRLIKENYRLNEPKIKTGYQIIVVWKNNNSKENAKFDNISKDLLKCLKKADLFIVKEE